MKLPNGPRSLSYIYLLRWIVHPLELLEDCAQRYGDPFTLGLVGPFRPTVFFSNPQAIQHIFSLSTEQAEVDIWSNRPLLPILGKNSLLLLNGSRHQNQRKLLMPPFHGERMRTYAQMIVNITQEVISHWQIGQPFSVRSSTQEIALRVILHAVFGLTAGHRYQQLFEKLSALLHAISAPVNTSMLYIRLQQQDWGVWSPWGNFLDQLRQIDALLYAEIQQRRQQTESDSADILSLLLAARDEVGQPMTDLELRDELMTLLLAGHETTASALSWALYWIHDTPGVLDKLLQELDSFGAFASDAIAQMPYLNAVCQETLRIYPLTPVAFPRIAKVPLEIEGYQIEPGTALAPCIYLTHQRPDLYPDPKSFRPERFLERQYSPYEYLPFGGGNRRCIGLAFAQFEMKLVLAIVLSTWQLKLAEKRPVQPTRRGVTIAPRGGVRVVATGLRPKNEQVIQQAANINNC